MINPLKIKDVIEKLATFCLVKGVQPDELVTAIFEGEYDSIETQKKDNSVYVIVTYRESVDDDENIIKMKYTYNTDKQLQRVEQKINTGVYKTQWDRESKIELILNELLENIGTDKDLHIFIRENIPNELRGIVYPKLKIAC